MTPAGTPSTVTLSPRASRTSLAVPSPPTKTRMSIPCLSIDLAVRIVSVLVVLDPTLLIGANSRPSSLAKSPPIRPPAMTRLTSGFLPMIDKNSFARPGETGLAPRLIASCMIVGPSVPLRPTAPPVPAMGLRMNPILANYPQISSLSIDHPAPANYIS